jgi:hypothetical protein
MMALFRLEWERDTRGYRLERPTADRASVRRGLPLSGTGSEAETYVVPIGAGSKRYTASLCEDTIFLDLVQAPPDEDGVLEFTRKWGLLTKQRQTMTHFIRASSRIRRAAIELMNEGLSPNWVHRHGQVRTGKIQVGFDKAVRQSGYGVFYYPENLFTFCWLEMLQTLVGGIDVQQCERCGTLIGRPKAGPAPRFCSAACKQANWRIRQRDKGVS